MATDWAADVKKYAAKADDAAIAGIVRYLGIALRNRDSSLVSFSDKTETDRVRTNYLKKKLGLTQSDAVLDAAIAKVGVAMKADRTKNRVTVYYLLAAEFKQLGLFVKAPAAAKKAPAAKAPAAKSAAPKAADKPAAKKTAAKVAGAAAAVAGAAAASKTAAKPAAKAATKAAPKPAAKAATKAAPKPAAKLSTAKSAPTKAVAVKAPAAKAAAKPAAKKVAAKPASGAVAGTIAAGAAVAGAAVAAASGAAGAAKDTAAKAAGAVGDAAGAAVGVAGDAAGKVGDMAGAAVGAVGNAAGTAAGAVTGAAGAAADKAAALFTPGSQAAKSDDEGGMGWLLWLLVGALVLFALWWMFMRGGDDSAASNAPATEAAASMEVGSASGAAADLAAAPAEGTVAIPDGAGVTSEMRDGKPVVKVYFDTGKTDVAAAFAATAGGLNGFLEGHPGAKLAISGYSDPSGNAKFNAELSKQRAQAVQAALVSSGIPAEAAELVKPANSADGTVSKEAARRVEVTVQ